MTIECQARKPTAIVVGSAPWRIGPAYPLSRLGTFGLTHSNAKRDISFLER
jgi:hypothetical protein